MTTSVQLPDACLNQIGAHMRPEFFQALCDPVRIALVAHLAANARPLTVTEASECCGIHFSGVSRHLGILRRAGVVRSSKRGREVLYELELDAFTASLRGLADALESCWASGKASATSHAAG